ncbi:MAG: hypothetical protein R6X06_05735 [Gammaproteobacteria bacterium]
MAKRRKPHHPDAPLLYPDHARPVSRRDFIRQGLLAGAGLVMAPPLLGLLGGARNAYADLADDVAAAVTNCGINFSGGSKIPFICFDLAGGASIAGSNVLVGQAGGQEDALSTAGYVRMGIPGDMLPSMTDPGDGLSYTDDSCGLLFYKDSGFLRGIKERAPGALANTNGAIIAARSDNDTGNNPHNPMYGIHKAGAYGELLKLIGSRNTDSGGNSMAPALMIDPAARPTKVDRRSDATGLVDTGDLSTMFPKSADTVNVMESIYRLSNAKLGSVSTGLANDATVKSRVDCEYVKSAALVENYSDPTALDPMDNVIVSASGTDAGSEIFTTAEYNADGEFRKTAAVMKLVVNGYAGAGTITMGGYDYHTGNRSTGELRDLRAGRCIGACLEYARRRNKPIMIYVYSDGSVFSNGATDSSVEGRGKGVWTGDNSGTAASFFLVYDPRRRPVLTDPARHQIGYYSAMGNVITTSSPCANNVNLLVETVVLNYMALHDQQNLFATSSYFPNQGLGNSTMLDSLTAFAPLYNGTLTNGV